MVRILPLLLIVAGCGGPSPETLVDELRVMSIAPESPEVSPGASTTVAVDVLDPTGEGAVVRVWSCATTGECGDVTTGDIGRTSAPVAVPEDVGATEDPQELVVIYGFACRADVCPPASTFEGTGLIAPFSWLTDLPLEGTSLGIRSLMVSTRDDKHTNPLVGLIEPLPASIGVGETLDIGVSVDGELGDATVYGYATGGGFTGSSAVADAHAELSWIAPDEPGSAQIVIVVEDGLGGVATIEGAVAVE